MTTEAAPASGLAVLVQFRRQLAIGLVAIGVVLTVLTIWWGIWGWPSKDDPNKPTTPEVKAEDESPLPEPPKPDVKQRTHSVDYLPAAVWAGLLAVLCFGSAVWLLTQPLPPGGEESGVRTELLAFGSSVGFLTAVLGVLLAVRWHESLFKWVNEGKTGEARWILIAACVFTAGLIIMFASLQLARAEERANVTLRRMLYGFNAVFLGLLLLMVLTVVNVLSFLKVPSTLVTTDAAFTELSEPSKTFLRSLDQPVHVYLILPEKYQLQLRSRTRAHSYDRLYVDTRSLLSQCEDQSKYFKATYLSPGLDATRIASLLEQYKVKLDERDKEPTGLLVVVGEGNEASTFISSEDLIDVMPMDRNETVVFQGENKLITELAYLTDTRSKEVVYFTQDHGELAIEPGGAGNRTASGVVQFLRDKRMRVEALNLDPKDPKVPADAAVVVVAGPQQLIAPDSPTVKALRAYLKPPGPERRPGKLLALLPAIRGAQGEVLPTGLEPLLEEFGVNVVPDRRLVSAPNQFPLGRGQDGRLIYAPPDTVVTYTNRELQLPLRETFGPRFLLLKDCRPVRPGQGPPGSLRTHQLLTTVPRARHWLDDFKSSAITTFNQITSDPAVAAAKQYSTAPVPVAVAVTEGGAAADPKKGERPRMIVYGSDTSLQDRAEGPVAVPEDFAQLVLSDSIDWLREREASLGIPPKKAATYTIGRPPEWSSLLTLLAIMTVGIGGLGVGVWLSRRR
jgi:hypothetical protein